MIGTLVTDYFLVAPASIANRWLYAAVAMACLLAALRLSRFLANLPFRRAKVNNVSDVSLFMLANPPGLVTQAPGDPALHRFRDQLPAFREPPQTLERAIEIRRWVRSLQSDRDEQWRARFATSVTDPLRLIEEFAAQRPGTCRRFAYVTAAALISDGFHARVVHAAEKISNRASGHTLTEVWLPALAKWVLLDATFDVTYLVEGQPASILDLNRLVHQGSAGKLQVIDDGLGRIPILSDTQEFLAQFRHVFALQTMDIFRQRDGRSMLPSRRLEFIHLCDGDGPRYPCRRKTLALLACTALVLAGAMASWQFMLSA